MKLKSLSLLLAAATLCAPMIVADDSLEDVLAKYHKAIGGLEAWNEVQSLRTSGRMLMPMGIEAPYTMTFVRPLKTRLEFTFQGMTGVQVFDGERAWAILPFMGSSEPHPMPEEQARFMREQADFSGPLIDWEAKGHQIELVGKADWDEVEIYHLKVTLDGGDVRHFFLDAQSYLPIRMVAVAEIRGSEEVIETLFSDFEKVGDLVMAHSIESRPKGAPEGQVLTVEKIEIDVDVSDDLFVMPDADVEQPQPAEELEDGQDEEPEEGEAAV